MVRRQWGWGRIQNGNQLSFGLKKERKEEEEEERRVKFVKGFMNGESI